MLDREDVLGWLRETDACRLQSLWRQADDVRRNHVGDAVHLRGLIELSNHCVRTCSYCGLRAPNQKLRRYRMTMGEVLDCARRAERLEMGTVVLQSGEDDALTGECVAHLISEIRRLTPLAITLSLGERSEEDLARWKEAGADRYLLRFETSNHRLFQRIHPPRGRQPCDRIGLLTRLRELGFEVGSGVMIGIPGQSCADLADDILLFRKLELDMIGVGPYIPHPDTPLGHESRSAEIDHGDQTPNDELTTYKVIALTRLVCPWANIPATTALSTINRETGRELGLSRGANILMPNLTPSAYQYDYEIYPAKGESGWETREGPSALKRRVVALGRFIGTGRGDSQGFIRRRSGNRRPEVEETS